jgi:peptide-methionine (S)-S-oxide reductase
MPRSQRVILALAVILAVAYAWLRGAFVLADGTRPSAVAAEVAGDGSQVATFAAGCFWSVQLAFEDIPGVQAVVAGYTGGTVADPSYEQVSAGATGHAEAVQIRFDPARVTYTALLDRFWHEVDLFEGHRQFCDLGDEYRPAVFVHDSAQRLAAESTRAHWQQYFGRPVRVEVTDAGPFFKAEAYHQHYATKNPIQYEFYRWNCGRDARLRSIWKRK